ncbi:hypothetical protein SALB1_2783 [Salinisphaera sp. LB1]|nr:hypothetical protein SALB1_2783 [Salinisphaera sp. LB1]
MLRNEKVRKWTPITANKHAFIFGLNRTAAVDAPYTQTRQRRIQRRTPVIIRGLDYVRYSAGSISKDILSANARE